MSLTSCSRHPEEPAKALCGRCGDFLCAKCKAESRTGLCPACGARPGPAPSSQSSTTLALIVAVLCALLSGGFLLATSALYIGLAGATTWVPFWNGAMGLTYFGIAYGLVQRSATGYSWSIGTQRLNAALGVYNIFTLLSKPSPSTLLVALSGVSLALHIVGWFSTWLARDHFTKPR